MSGRFHVHPDDLARVAPAVLRHRILLNFQAEADGRTPDEIVAALLAEVRPPSTTAHSAWSTPARSIRTDFSGAAGRRATSSGATIGP